MKLSIFKTNLKFITALLTILTVSLAVNAGEDMNNLLKKIDSSTAVLSKELQSREATLGLKKVNKLHF